MLRETSQSLPNTKLSPNRLRTSCDCPIRRMKKYASSARIAAASARRPQRRTVSGIRPPADRSRIERRPETAVVALASTDPPYDTGEPLQTSFASCAVSFDSSDEGSGAYGIWPLPDPSVC